jgi:hypothetical protein
VEPTVLWFLLPLFIKTLTQSARLRFERLGAFLICFLLGLGGATGLVWKSEKEKSGIIGKNE